MATMPNTLFADVRPIKRFSTRMLASPYNYTQQVYSYVSTLKVLEITLPVLDSTDASSWIAFFNACNGYEDTFNMNLSQYYPGESGLTSVAMRLANPEVTWNLRPPLNYQFSFMVMEAR